MPCRWRNACCMASLALPTKESMSGSFRKIPIEVAPAKPAAEQEVVSLYAAQKKIYPRSVHGRIFILGTKPARRMASLPISIIMPPCGSPT